MNRLHDMIFFTVEGYCIIYSSAHIAVIPTLVMCGFTWITSDMSLRMSDNHRVMILFTSQFIKSYGLAKLTAKHQVILGYIFRNGLQYNMLIHWPEWYIDLIKTHLVYQFKVSCEIPPPTPGMEVTA